MSDDLIDDGADLPPLADAYPDVAAWFDADPVPSMPEDVWVRLESALAEQTPLTAPGAATVTALASPAGTGRRPRRLAPLIGAAAGLVLVGAVGIPVVLGGTAAGPPVADGSAEPSVLASSSIAAPDPTTPTAEAPAPSPAPAEPAPEQPSDQVTEPAPETPTEVVAPSDAMAVPARLIVASGTDYSPDAMTPQVTSLITTAGLVQSEDMASEVVTIHSSAPRGLPPLVGSAGFTSDVQALRDCVSRLHAARGGDAAGVAMPALLVDRASFNGSDAGVVVMLHSTPGTAPYLDVAVVGPDCSDDDVAAAVWFEYALP